jgi:glucans biosynthesis protein C
MVQRRYDFDVLRVFCTASIFLFHCLCIFAAEDYFITNPQTSTILYVVVYLMLVWMLPVFFIISGRVTYYLLGRDSTLGLLKSRFLRCMVPFIFGVLFLSPIIIYLTRVFHHEYSGSLFSFYVNNYFHGFYGYGGNFSFLGNHLFYLLYLFGFTAFFLLLFRRNRWKRDQVKKHDWLALFQKPGAIFLLSIPIIITTELNFIDPTVFGRTGTGGWNIFSHFLFFAYGLLFSSDHRFDTIIDRHWKISGVIAIPLLATYAWFLTDIPYYTAVASWPKAIVLGLAGFTTVLAIFGFAHQKITNPVKNITTLNEAVMPFYIIHFPIVIIFGFYVTQLDLGLIPKLAMVIGLSLVSILALYQVIKRFRVLRFLFGMKVKWRKNAEEEI